MQIDDEIKDRVMHFLDTRQKNMGDALGITFLSFEKDKIKASMPVNEHTIQPFGILHGGASVALAETLASLGAWIHAGEGKSAVGVEINANHIRAVPRGQTVIGIATPVHTGRQIHVWDIEIETESGKKVCVSRCTLAIVNDRSNRP